jgi:hypothetical protein
VRAARATPSAIQDLWRSPSACIATSRKAVAYRCALSRPSFLNENGQPFAAASVNSMLEG